MNPLENERLSIFIGLLRGVGPREGSLMLPKVPQSSLEAQNNQHKFTWKFWRDKFLGQQKENVGPTIISCSIHTVSPLS